MLLKDLVSNCSINFSVSSPFVLLKAFKSPSKAVPLRRGDSSPPSKKVLTSFSIEGSFFTAACILLANLPPFSCTDLKPAVL